MDATTRRRVRNELADLCRLVDDQSKATAHPRDEPRLMGLLHRYLGIRQGEPLTGKRWTYCPDRRQLELEPRVGVYLVSYGLERNGVTTGTMGRTAIMGATTCIQLPSMDAPAIFVHVVGASRTWPESYLTMYGLHPQRRRKHACSACSDTGLLAGVRDDRYHLCPHCPGGDTWQPDGQRVFRPVTAADAGGGGQ